MLVYICVHTVSACVYPFYLHRSPSRCICMTGLSLWRIPPQPEWGLRTCLDPHRSLSQRMGLEERKHDTVYYNILHIILEHETLTIPIQLRCRNI